MILLAKKPVESGPKTAVVYAILLIMEIGAEQIRYKKKWIVSGVPITCA